MWKVVSGIKTLVGLSAFSLAVAYLLVDKVIEKNLIQTSFGVALLFIFFFLFVVTNLLLIIFSRKRQEKTSTNGLHQQVGLAKNVEQTARIGKNIDADLNVSQKTTVAGSVKQEID